MERTMRRATIVLMAVMIAVVLVVFANAVTPTPADAATRVVTKTFSSNQPITIPSAGSSGTATPYPSERNVQGFDQGIVLDVNLTLKNFSHTFPDDVDVLLSKKGKTRTVMSDVGAVLPMIPTTSPSSSTTRLPMACCPTMGRSLAAASSRPTWEAATSSPPRRPPRAHSPRSRASMA